MCKLVVCWDLQISRHMQLVDLTNFAPLRMRKFVLSGIATHTACIEIHRHHSNPGECVCSALLLASC